MTRRILAIAGALALQLIALVLAHDLTFLVRYGSRYGEALVHAGHGETWAAAVSTSAVLAFVLASLAIARLLQLGARLRSRAGAGARATSDPRAFLAVWARTAARIAVVGVVLLTIQENVERASIGGVAPGPGLLLSPEYPFGLWIALAVGAGVAFVSALFQHRVGVLLARIRAARRPHARGSAASPVRRAVPAVRALDSILGRRSGRRAPPLAVPA